MTPNKKKKNTVSLMAHFVIDLCGADPEQSMYAAVSDTTRNCTKNNANAPVFSVIIDSKQNILQ